ncbi:MAG: SurA N-terminal domain-containing protein [Gammaproteobacteria bacterium]
MKKNNMFLILAISSMFTVQAYAEVSANPAPNAPMQVSPTQIKAKTKSAKSVQTLDKIAAIVNDDVIMESEVNARMDGIKQQLIHSNSPVPPNATLRKEVLENIIDMNLQIQVAHKAGLSISDAEIDGAIANIAKQNHLSVADFKNELTRSGMDYNAFRKQISDQMLSSRVVQEGLGKEITLTPKEVSDYLATHKMPKLKEADKVKAAQNAIYRDKIMAGAKDWVKKLRDSAYVKIM